MDRPTDGIMVHRTGQGPWLMKFTDARRDVGHLLAIIKYLEEACGESVAAEDEETMQLIRRDYYIETQN